MKNIVSDVVENLILHFSFKNVKNFVNIHMPPLSRVLGHGNGLYHQYKGERTEWQDEHVVGCRHREEVRKTVEKTTRTVKESIGFEKSGESFSVEIALENVSPTISSDTIIQFLDTLFEKAKENIKG